MSQHTIFPKTQFILDLKKTINDFVNSNLKSVHQYAEQTLNQPFKKPTEYHHDFSSLLFSNLNLMITAIEEDQLEDISTWAHALFNSDYRSEFYTLIPLQAIKTDLQKTLLLESNSLYQEHFLREFSDKIVRYDFSNFKTHFSKALGLVEKIVPEFYTEITYFVKEIYILNQRPPKQGSGMGVFGALFFSHEVLSPSIIDAYERIIHESAHLFLYAVSFIDPIVLNDTTEQYHHGLREDLRPMIAVFHACFVLGRMIFSLEKLLTRAKKNPALLNADEINRADTLLTHYKERLTISLQSLRSDGKLTKVGKKLIQPILEMGTH